MKTQVKPPLSNVQAELLRLFSSDIPDEELKELKLIMAEFLLKKARMKADAIWDQRNYSDEKLLEILSKK
jgi:hypothetical protein